MPSEHDPTRLKPEDVLRFWFEELTPEQWFRGSVDLDEQIRSRFGDAVARAMAGDFDHWTATAEGALALVLLLDQVPRNIHRDSARAFAHDARARAVAKAAIEAGFDGRLSAQHRIFIYLPLEHSEEIVDQERSVALFEALGDPVQADYARRHHAVIARFGRFPHRNAVLGRKPTTEELDYLKERDKPF